MPKNHWGWGSVLSWGHSSKGFTLIELLVVISIIGLLASVVLVALNSARQKSRDAKRVSDMNQVAKALELFYNDAGAYPTGTGAPGGTYTVAGGATLGSTILQAITAKGTFNITPTYMTGIPSSPNPAETACTTANNSYKYESNSAGTFYTLTFCVGATTGSITNGGVHYLTPGGFR